MPLRLQWLPASRADARNIWRWIAADSPRSADRVLARFDEVLDMLGRMPFAGRARLELVADLRSYPVGEYVIFYRATLDAILVVRILHGHQDIDSDTF